MFVTLRATIVTLRTIESVAQSVKRIPGNHLGFLRPVPSGTKIPEPAQLPDHAWRETASARPSSTDLAPPSAECLWMRPYALGVRLGRGNVSHDPQMDPPPADSLVAVHAVVGFARDSIKCQFLTYFILRQLPIARTVAGADPRSAHCLYLRPVVYCSDYPTRSSFCRARTRDGGTGPGSPVSITPPDEGRSGRRKGPANEKKRTDSKLSGAWPPGLSSGLDPSAKSLDKSWTFGPALSPYRPPWPFSSTTRQFM